MVRYCCYCGNEVNEEADVCIKCGCMIKKSKPIQSKTEKTQTSIILGIIGIVFAWLMAIVGHIVSIIGIAIGIKEYTKTEKMTGLILNIIGEICSMISTTIVLLVVGYYYY